MRRILVLSLLVVGVAVALGIGSYTALAGGGPVTDVADAVIGADEPDDGDGTDTDDADDADGEDDATNDVEGDDVDAQDGDDGGEAEGAERIAGLIAGAFEDVEEDEVLTLHEEEGIGFGALFKLCALAAAMDTTVAELLTTMDTDGDGEYEFGFGELRNSLTGDQPAVLESGPKNLGQLVSAAHHEENGGAGGVTTQGGGQGNAFGRDHGQGKPQGVPPDGGGE